MMVYNDNSPDCTIKPVETKQAEDLSCLQLVGVGKQIARHLARLEIYTIQDVLLHLPFRYQDKTQIMPIARLVPGEHAVIEGELVAVSVPRRGKTKLLCEITDGARRLFLRFFHVLPFQMNVLKPGARLRCFSEVRLGVQGLEMFHPEFQVILPDKPLPIDSHLTPIYPATEGLSQYVLRKLTQEALKKLKEDTFLPELIPAAVRQTLNLPTLKEAINFLHRPPVDASVPQLLSGTTPQQKRLAFEELLAHRLSLMQTKNDLQVRQGFPLESKSTLTAAFLQKLPFGLTAAQTRVVQEIAADLQQPFPMLRLVQGDVGSGKTVVAALSMLLALENGYQAALMVPTELLAEQHYRSFEKWLQPLGIKMAFLTGQIKGRARSNVLKAIANHEAQIIIGTHALFQEEVQFARLALVVTDEQHRFGVEQRALFREKGVEGERLPHQLVLTATPIPRTLAMSFYADLNCSVIDELPPGRQPVKTSVISSTRRREVVQRIHDICKAGRQAYWVCPLIEESEVIACQAATQSFMELQQQLPDLRIGLIHGRMPASEKEAVMKAFKQNEIHLLVATTVIEVGVDVPNASLMVIENAERLGLAQLHQLRGRVGRGSAASFCLLLYQEPLSPLARERLTVMRETNDGFIIAERDLKLRGPGELFGTRQTGELSFYVADLARDSDMLSAIHAAAEIIQRDYTACIALLIKRWLQDKAQYQEV